MAASSKPDESGQSGFTLIEMMIVVAIVAVLAAIAVPSFSDFIAKNRVKSASEGIAAFLADAKSQSVLRNQDVYVDIVTGASWCLGFIPDPDGATTCDCEAGTCVADVSGTAVTQAISSADHPGVALLSNIDATTFDRLRGTAGAGTINVTSDSWRLNTVVSGMGRVQTCKPDNADGIKGVQGYPSC